ncbi:hypothetical protein ACLB1Q_06440 [Escherichia coli]
MMMYGHVYVAQISLGAQLNQTVKAIQEAEAYPGPSLIIAYSPCEEHGYDLALSHDQECANSQLPASGRYIASKMRVASMKANCRWRWIHARRQKHWKKRFSRATFPSSEFAAARSGRTVMERCCS